MPSINPDPLVGTTLGAKYELVRRLGAGGMGVVYEAVNGLTGRRVAVKLLIGDALDTQVRQRLLREARAAGCIRHPNVVDVLDVAIDPDSGPFLVMELLAGESLEDRLVREGRLSFADVAPLLLPLAEALQVAHDARIVHRDIKPSNIFLHTGARGELIPKLVDFGIARSDGPRLTRSGMMAGTLGYMAPEQMHDAKRADQRSDIWSLGVVVYECFAGRLPFAGETAVQMMSSVLSGNLVPLDQVAPATPGSVVRAVHRALTLDATERPQSVAEFMRLAGFEALHAGAGSSLPPPPAPTTPMSVLPVPGVAASTRPTRPRRWAVTAALGVALLGFTTLVRRGRSVPSPTAATAPGPREVHFGSRLPLPSVESRAIAGGTAMLGSSPEEVRAAVAECASESSPEACPEARFNVELPTRTVEVRALAVGRHEVTFGELYAWLTHQTGLRVRGATGRDWLADTNGPLVALAGQTTPEAGLALEAVGLVVRPGFAQKPAVWVTQRTGHLFCKSVGGRLLTSAEWEWAARGEARRRYPWGNAFFSCHRAVAARASGQACHGLAKSQAGEAVSVLEQLQDETPDGVSGLAGNVAEWVVDGAPPPTSTRSSEGWFVVRGGDWASEAVLTRATARRTLEGDGGAAWVGLRCAFPEPIELKVK